MWKQLASNDPASIHNLIPLDRPTNLALVVGPTSGILDIEPDDPEASHLIESMMARNRVKTISYNSTNRGVHRLFRWTPRLDQWTTKNPKAGKLECRLGTSEKGFYSICPPSVHKDTGLYYHWLPGCAPWETSIAEVPEELIEYFLANVKDYGATRVLELDQHDDGWVPGVGGRHDYLLSLSQLCYTKMRMPRDLAEDITRTASKYIGSYEVEGRGEVEIRNLFAKLHRRPDEVGDLFNSVDMSQVSAFVDHTFEEDRRHTANDSDEIPSHIFSPVIEQASQWAKASQLPRNMWLMSFMSAAAFAVGTGARIRVSVNHEPMGFQIYSFGVGGSGTGKSRAIKAQLGPFANSERLTTEATSEGLVSEMMKFPRGLLLALSEGKDFSKMLGKYGQNGLQSDNSLFHKCWSGDPIIRTLQTKRHAVLNPHLVICAGIQKINLNQMPLADCNDGLLQRMDICDIGSVPRTPDKIAQQKLTEFAPEYLAILSRLASVNMPYGDKELTALALKEGMIVVPKDLVLSPRAAEMWQDYASMKQSDFNLSQWPEDHPHRSDAIRHAEKSLRFSGMLWLTDYAVNPEEFDRCEIAKSGSAWVPEDVLQRAIDHQEHLWSRKQILCEGIVEAAFSAVSSVIGISRTESIPEKTTEFVKQRRRRMEKCGRDWTTRDYYATFRLRKAVAAAEIDMLVREGYVIVLPVIDSKPAQRYRFTEKDREE